MNFHASTTANAQLALIQTHFIHANVLNHFPEHFVKKVISRQIEIGANFSLIMF